MYGEPVSNSVKNDYMIEIATIQDTPRKTKRVKQPRQKPKAKRSKPQPKLQPKPSGKDHPLYEDCVGALIVLGEKAASSRKIAATILSEENITSVEQFITMVYSRN